jgi:hypothetical protein
LQALVPIFFSVNVNGGPNGGSSVRSPGGRTPIGMSGNH